MCNYRRSKTKTERQIEDLYTKTETKRRFIYLRETNIQRDGKKDVDREIQFKSK